MAKFKATVINKHGIQIITSIEAENIDSAKNEADRLEYKLIKPLEKVCEHEFVSKEYASQPYGTCISCGQTVFNQ